MRTIEELSPAEVIETAQSVTEFLATIFSDMAFRGSGNDMGPTELNGMYEVLNDVSIKLERAKNSIVDADAKAEQDLLTRLGLPEEALLSSQCRAAWRDGYAHGLKGQVEEIE